jgi:2-isopropylmalate synthase
MSPESIGLSKNKLVLGKHSGRHAFSDRIKSMGYTLNDEEINRYFEEFKRLCDKKKNVGDDDIVAIITSELSARNTFYKLDRFDVFTSNASRGTCVISLESEGEVHEDVALGDGPIDAAYNAIDKLIDAPAHSLEGYAIRSVTEGKDALGEVVVKIKSGDKLVTGRGLSTNIIESSILAYLNGVNKILERRDTLAEAGDV